MKTFIKQHSYSIFLFIAILLFSCTGGSLGMTMHSLMDMHGEYASSCCSGEMLMAESGNHKEAGAVHQHDAPPVVFFSLLALFVFWIFVSRFFSSIEQRSKAIYARARDIYADLISYFCTQIFFSRGILHGKTW